MSVATRALLYLQGLCTVDYVVCMCISFEVRLDVNANFIPIRHIQAPGHRWLLFGVTQGFALEIIISRVIVGFNIIPVSGHLTICSKALVIALFPDLSHDFG